MSVSMMMTGRETFDENFCPCASARGSEGLGPTSERSRNAHAAASPAAEKASMAVFHCKYTGRQQIRAIKSPLNLASIVYLLRHRSGGVNELVRDKQTQARRSAARTIPSAKWSALSAR